DRTADAGKSPQLPPTRWNDPAQSSRESRRWVLSATVCACAVVIAAAALLGITALHRTMAKRAAEEQARAAKRHLDEAFRGVTHGMGIRVGPLVEVFLETAQDPP